MIISVFRLDYVANSSAHLAHQGNIVPQVQLLQLVWKIVTLDTTVKLELMWKIPMESTTEELVACVLQGIIVRWELVYLWDVWKERIRRRLV